MVLLDTDTDFIDDDMVWYANCMWYAKSMAMVGLLWYGMVCKNMVCYGMLWYAMVRFDMVWYAKTWYAMVCYGMLWYAMV